MKTLTINTPHGTFNRATATAYTHAVVRTSERAAEAFKQSLAAKPGSREARWAKSGVTGRWTKDRGFAVTWHGSEQVARNAAAGHYAWDKKTGPAAIYATTEKKAAPKATAKKATKISLTITHVVVNGKQFHSVKQAFEALKLPLGRHIRFRMALKAAGKLVFEDGKKRVTFTIAKK